MAPNRRPISDNRGNPIMSTITTKDGTQIYYKDWGSGKPVVFSHGWPLSADAWESQMVYLGSNGYRCIAHDRRRPARLSQGLSEPLSISSGSDEESRNGNRITLSSVAFLKLIGIQMNLLELFYGRNNV